MKNTFDTNRFREQGDLFLTKLLNELTELGIPAASFEIDHICYRVENETQYTYFKSAFESLGDLLTESTVNGRSISSFRLHEPLRVSGKFIELLELPAPKLGSKHSLGFEHAEFVINESFDQFQNKFSQLSFKTSGNKNTNPELCLQTQAGQAKFHYLPLSRVIQIEQARIQNIIFDFDGTLINSRNAIDEINSIVFSEVLSRNVTLEEAQQKFSPEFSKLLIAYGINCLKKQKKAISFWGEVSQRFSFSLFEGIYELLQCLSKMNCHLHLWTARDETSARAILKSLQIEDLFSTLSFATEVDSKPHKNSLKLEVSSFEPHTTLVIGDSSTDIRGAHNVGAIAAAALWDSHAKKEDLIANKAELFFYSLEEFEHWIVERV